MSYSAPTPPDELTEDLVDQLDAYISEQLRAIAEYVEALAEHREREERLEDTEDGSANDQERPDGVPSKASLTVKTINENRYHYWQWREGDSIKSQYKGPVEKGE